MPRVITAAGARPAVEADSKLIVPTTSNVRSTIHIESMPKVVIATQPTLHIDSRSRVEIDSRSNVATDSKAKVQIDSKSQVDQTSFKSK